MEEKKILFIGVGFHEYDSFIINHLEKSFEVSYLNCSGFRLRHPYLFSLAKVSPGLLSRFNDNTTTAFIEQTKSKNFDVVFIIKGTNLKDHHFTLLRKYHPHAKFVLYLWDAWSLIPNRGVLNRNFATIYSFDSEDCKKYGFVLRPLFFLKADSESEKLYDISFVGNGHSNRLKLMQELKDLCLRNGLKYKFVVNMGIPAYIKSKFLPQKLSEGNEDIISAGSIPYSEYLEIIRKSRVVVDIHYNKQTGLTMRTIEALAAGARVITTNEHISEYSNIPSNMYLIWDKKVDECLVDFIKKPRPEFVLDSYYSIDAFLDELLK